MDDEISARLHQLSDRILDVGEIVSTLAEETERKIPDIKACIRAIEEIVEEYQSILTDAPKEEHPVIERRHGHMVVELRQRADFLPKMSRGHPAVLAERGEWPFLPQASRSINARPPRQMSDADGLHDRDELRVGGEVEAWCGHCDELRQHTIVAMVQGKPKQVICQSCASRHGYRLTPARPKKQVEDRRPRRSPSQQEEKARREKEAQLALHRELAEATDPRPFVTRARYKAGEIIEHPEHGRGKIENVLRGSLLVRFRNGLRSISTL